MPGYDESFPVSSRQTRAERDASHALNKLRTGYIELSTVGHSLVKALADYQLDELMSFGEQMSSMALEERKRREENDG